MRTDSRPQPVNTGRQYNLDLLKAFSIVTMVLCHVFLRLGSARPGFGSETGFLLGTYVLGQYCGVAHAFMLAMGIGIIYSRHSTPKELLKKGIRLYIMAYVLNFCRYGVYILAEGLITGTLRSEFAYAMYTPDILQFAGLAFMLTALLRKLKLNETVILGLAIVMNMVAAPLAFTTTGSTAGDVILGSFIVTTKTEALFPLLTWYLFVAAGMWLGRLLQRTSDTDTLYRRLLAGSGIIMLIYVGLTFKLGMFFGSKGNWYFCSSLIDGAGLMSIDLFLLSAFYYLLKVVDVARLRFALLMSKHVTKFFCIHWCILGPFNCLTIYVLGMQFSYWAMLGIGVALLLITYIIIKLIWGRKTVR